MQETTEGNDSWISRLATEKLERCGDIAVVDEGMPEGLKQTRRNDQEQEERHRGVTGARQEDAEYAVNNKRVEGSERQENGLNPH